MHADERPQRHHGPEVLPEEDGRPVFFRGMRRVDWVLFALTAPLSLFVLQFATNVIVERLDVPAIRRSVMVVLLLLEIALVVGAVFYIRDATS